MTEKSAESGTPSLTVELLLASQNQGKVNQRKVSSIPPLYVFFYILIGHTTRTFPRFFRGQANSTRVRGLAPREVGEHEEIDRNSSREGDERSNVRGNGGKGGGGRDRGRRWTRGVNSREFLRIRLSFAGWCTRHPGRRRSPFKTRIAKRVEDVRFRPD